jgi:hypothetical protein
VSQTTQHHIREYYNHHIACLDNHRISVFWQKTRIPHKRAILKLLLCSGSHIEDGASFDKVKVKFALEQATKFQKGSRGTALLFL